MALRITRITIENYKRIKLVEVELDPSGNLIIISGANASGKTSLLDGIENTLNGTRNAPAIPVRIGAKKAKVALQLGDQKEPNQFTVRRVTDAVTHRTSLIITSADGKQYSSPQTFLDALLGPLSFDPLAFARKDPRKQAEQLQELVGIDFTELDEALATQQEDRTAAGREVRRIKGSLDSLTFHQDAGAAVVVETLMAELEKRQKQNADHKTQRSQATQLERDAATSLILEESESDRLAGARHDIEEAKAEADRLEIKVQQAQNAYNLACRQRDQAFHSIRDLVDLDVDEVRANIASAEQHNEKWRENSRYLQTRQELEDAEEKHDSIKKEIEASGEAREEMLANAKFPIEGLGFDEHGVTYRGVPFSQASSAQQLRVSLSIVLNMHPGIAVVLIRDGSLLDKKSRHIVATMVKEAGAQCLMECTDDEGSGECRIVIEDGSIKE